MIVDDGLANRLADLLVMAGPHVFALHLLDDDHTFLVVDLDAERRAGAGDQAGMTLAGRPLDVAGIMIPAAHDDQVLETPGDVQVAVPEESEISGPQVFASRFVRGNVRQRGLENLASRVGCPQ